MALYKWVPLKRKAFDNQIPKQKRIILIGQLADSSKAEFDGLQKTWPIFDSFYL